MNISYRTGLLEENSLFKKNNLFADIEFLIFFFFLYDFVYGILRPSDLHGFWQEVSF